VRLPLLRVGVERASVIRARRSPHGYPIRSGAAEVASCFRFVGLPAGSDEQE
jgi:hypothetical protein